MVKGKKIVATIEARMGSTRLPNKIMLPIMGKPMLEQIVRRIQKAKTVNQVVIATSVNPQDKTVIDLAKKLRVGWFAGSETDVLDRVLKAAKKYHASHIVECWGDCPCVDPDLIDRVVGVCVRRRVDFAANNTLKKELPIGLDVMVFPSLVLEKVSQLSNDPYDHEHVSLYIYEHPKTFRLQHVATPTDLPADRVRLVVDTEKDFELIQRLYHLLYPKDQVFGHQSIAEIYKKFPQIFSVNQTVVQKKPRYTKQDDRDIKNKLRLGVLSFSPRYQAGIIGCGNIAGLFSDDPKRSYIASHAEAYQLNPELKLTAAADIDQKRLGEFGRRWDIPKLFTDYHELLKEKLDVVSICTKPEFHLKIVDDVVDSGIRKIICEKPFGMCVSAAEQVAEKAKKAGATILVHYNRRFDPINQKLADQIRQGRFGRFIGGVWYYCNGFVNNGCHAIDLVKMLVGPIGAVQTVGGDKLEMADNLDVVLTLRSGPRVVLKSVTSDNYVFEGELLFETAKVRFERLGSKIIIIPSITNPLASGSKIYAGVSQEWQTEIPQSLPRVISHILSVDKSKKVWSTAGEAANTLEVVTAAFLSSRRRGGLVRLPLSKREKLVVLHETVTAK